MRRTLSAGPQYSIQSPGGRPPNAMPQDPLQSKRGLPSSSLKFKNSKSYSFQTDVSGLSAVEPTTINPNIKTIMVIKVILNKIKNLHSSNTLQEDIKQVKQLLSKLDDTIDKKPDYVSIEIKEKLEQSFIKKMLDIFSQKVDEIKFTYNPPLDENYSPPSPNKMRLEQIKIDIKKSVMEVILNKIKNLHSSNTLQEDIKQVKQLLSKLDDTIDKKPDYVSIEIKKIKEKLEQSFIKKMLDIFSQKVDEIKFTYNPPPNEKDRPPSPNKMRLDLVKNKILKVVNTFFKEKYLSANKLTEGQKEDFAQNYYTLGIIMQNIERCFSIKFEQPSWIILT